MTDNNGKKNGLLDSLDTVTADDICDGKKKRRSIGEIFSSSIRYVLILVCTGALIYSGINIFSALKGYADQESIYGNLGDIINDAVGVEMMLPPSASPATPDYDASQNLTGADLEQFMPSAVNKEYERIRVKLANLKAQYPDLYGWISIPGTVINYPIMQTDNNDYYLNHSYTGSNLAAGSIYADYRCERDILDNRNLVIYGHHMSNNSMFYSLDYYFQETFFRANNTIYIYTLDGMYTYKVFSVYETNMYYPYIRTNFSDNSAFNTFAQTIKGNSIHKTEGIELNGTSKVLTLSTCTNRDEEGRIALHAVLTETYKKQ